MLLLPVTLACFHISRRMLFLDLIWFEFGFVFVLVRIVLPNGLITRHATWTFSTFINISFYSYAICFYRQILLVTILRKIIILKLSFFAGRIRHLQNLNSYMSHLQQYKNIIEVYMKPNKKSDLYVLNDYIANIKIESFAVFTSIQ